MFDYATLGSSDLLRSLRFYDATLATLGVVRFHSSQHSIAYRDPAQETHSLWVLKPFNAQSA